MVTKNMGYPVYFMRGSRVLSPKNVSIGHHVVVGRGTLLSGQGSLTIGNYVNIGPNVAIHTTNHRFADYDRPMALQGATIPRPVVIEDDVWLGVNAVVLPGNRIGRGAIVGANAVVTHDVEPFAIVGGVPARLIRYRFDADVRQKAAQVIFDSAVGGE